MIKTNIKLPIGYSADDIKEALTRALPISKDEIKKVNIIRRSINLSDKKDIHYDLTLEAEFSEEREAGLLKMKKKVKPAERFELDPPPSKLKTRPIVVGAGPAGLFAALLLAEAGAMPILYERGLSAEERGKKIKLFESLGILDTECNVQFGEGGAGAYSDGKLKVGAMDKYKKWILERFVECGAPADILFSATAHVGTDLLGGIISRIRKRIESLGGEVFFGTKLVSIKVRENRLVGGEIERDGKREAFSTDTLILATGHSAKDTFEMLLECGATLTPRPFGIGVRIEHKREYTDKMVYGDSAPGGIETASYHLVTHLKNGRSVYSFCMCPGGSVVAAASEKFGVVTNGMSEYRRDGENSNAAFLVSLTPEDFGSTDPLCGVSFQRKIEKAAYSLTSSYRAPTQRMEDFISDKKTSSFGEILPTYPIGTEFFRCEDYLPEFVTDSLRAAIGEFDEWMPGFYHSDALLTGPETRSTSPVRVERDETFSAVGIEGLYPIGEGAGYSGGIISSARDGAVVARSILERKNN